MWQVDVIPEEARKIAKKWFDRRVSRLQRRSTGVKATRELYTRELVRGSSPAWKRNTRGNSRNENRKYQTQKNAKTKGTRAEADAKDSVLEILKSRLSGFLIMRWTNYRCTSSSDEISTLRKGPRSQNHIAAAGSFFRLFWHALKPEIMPFPTILTVQPFKRLYSQLTFFNF